MGASSHSAISDSHLFYDAFNASPIGIVVEDLSGQPLFVNPAFCKMLGFTEEELRAKHCVDFSPAEDAEKDWVLFQQLKAQKIDHYQLEKRYFKRDGSLMWGRLSISRFEAGPSRLVIAMVEDITDKRAAQEAVRSREELLTTFVRNVPAGVAMFDRDMRYMQVSDRWCDDHAIDRSLVLGRSHYDVIPDLPERWRAMHQRGLAGEMLQAEEDRWDREGGNTLWLRWEICPWKTSSGVVGGILIFTEDITRRKQLEESISSLSQKLLESQEQERARIARELHDDFGQRLALMAMDLDQLRMDYPDLSADHRSRMSELQTQASDIARGIHALSHELHSSHLQLLGLVGGMRRLCNEFAEHQKLEIEFQSHDLPDPIPPDVALCLFRVLQEALQNFAKHSRVRHAEVRLWGSPGQIELTVRDLGVGFDSSSTAESHGLGLISMQERVKLVKGTFTIQSQRDGGTLLLVSVPFVPPQG